MNFTAIAAALIAMIVAAFGFVMRKSGRDAAAAKKEKENAKLRDEYAKIDGEKPSLDAAIDRLHKRGRGTDPK